ncbi:MauE/DoxX family redox-associated membrane protein [Arthrobacter sp. PsM3]|uniref:MauE/DoxX family redox-associated membrane protein n=1 Tax=Arthrobacter sp. PsM3 TaxID=3030531 RepID=UPI00345FBB7A
MTVLRVAVATIFVLAAVGKLSAPVRFTDFLAKSGLSARALTAGLVGVVTVELGIAVCLLLPGLERPGAIAATIAGGLFLLVQLRSWSTSRSSCACFGKIDDHQLPLVGTIRAAAVAASSLILVFSPATQFPSAMETTVGVLLAVTGIQIFAMSSGVLRLGDYRRRLRTELNWVPGTRGESSERTQEA